MTRAALIEQIQQKQSYLCIGLDTDISKIPQHLRQHPDAIFEFNKAIIDATKDICVSYKINTAFYEANGAKGWEVMERTLQYIPTEHFTIADAKRGDIGNTSTQYAKAFFETLNFDAITIAPYMGEDSVRPFLEFEGKWAIVLGLTSNSGSKDFEQLQVQENNSSKYLYEAVLEKVSTWGHPGNLMFVTGATKAIDFTGIRKIIPDHFLLVPGVGAQGGSLADVSKYGMNNDCGLLVNVSRAVIYAGAGEDYAIKAREAALAYSNEMRIFLKP
jgi:orotidine-5'-phosphate decarboxylase